MKIIKPLTEKIERVETELTEMRTKEQENQEILSKLKTE